MTLTIGSAAAPGVIVTPLTKVDPVTGVTGRPINGAELDHDFRQLVAAIGGTTPTSIGAATYSEGAWTPVLAGNGAAGTHTYSRQAGSYVKLGRLVCLLFELQLSTVDQAMSGGLIGVAGLPFVNSAAYGTANFCLYEGLTSPSASCTQIVGLINPYEGMVSILWTGSGVAPGQPQTKAGISNTALIYGSAMYRAVT